MNQPCDFCNTMVDQTQLTEYILDGEKYEICPDCLDAELFTFEGDLRSE
jgi:hypothetical protein